MAAKFSKLIMFIYWIVPCLLVSQTRSQIPPEMKLQIDNAVTEFNKMPGLGLAIVRNNSESLYTTGYGFRDVEQGVAADDATLFGIGSIAKSFTAVVVVRTLHEKFPELGETALDIPIRQLAPNYNFTLSDRYRSESVTFRDLLAHRTCLFPESLGINVIPIPTTSELVYRLRYAPEDCPFRTDFVYNNFVIVAAGEIIAHILQILRLKEWYCNAKLYSLQNLLTEIGMLDTTWIKDSDEHNSMTNRSAPYYQENGQIKKMNPELLKCVINDMADGGILSSARDMAKYIKFHLNLKKVGDVQVVPEEAMKWLYRASNLWEYGSLESQETDKITKGYAYALCLCLSTYDGWQLIQHGGYIAPYASLFTFAPELKLGIFTTTNGPSSASEEFSTNLLHNSILDILRGINSTKLLRKRPQKQKNSQNATKTPPSRISKRSRTVSVKGLV